MMFTHWSKSKMKTFRDCPHKFNLTYIKKIDVDVKVEALEKGKKLHDLFDKFWIRYSGDPAKAIEETVKDLNLDDAFVKKYIDHVWSFVDHVKRKQKYVRLDEMRPVSNEEWLEHGRWHGFIDRVDKVNEKYILLDYKTSHGNNIAEYADELMLYAWLYHQKYGIWVDYIGIFFTANNVMIVEKVTSEEIKESVELIDAEVDQYERWIGENNMPINPGNHCRWCHFKDTKYCTQEMRNKVNRL